MKKILKWNYKLTSELLERIKDKLKIQDVFYTNLQTL